MLDSRGLGLELRHHERGLSTKVPSRNLPPPPPRTQQQRPKLPKLLNPDLGDSEVWNHKANTHTYVAHNPFPLPSRAQTQTDTHARPHTYIFACIHTLTYSLTYLELSASNKKKRKAQTLPDKARCAGAETRCTLERPVTCDSVSAIVPCCECPHTS